MVFFKDNEILFVLGLAIVFAGFSLVLGDPSVTSTDSAPTMEVTDDTTTTEKTTPHPDGETTQSFDKPPLTPPPKDQMHEPVMDHAKNREELRRKGYKTYSELTPEERQKFRKLVEVKRVELQHVPEPDPETLERWGFYKFKLMGQIEEYRDREYERGLKKFSKLLSHQTQMSASRKREITAQFREHLKDDHNFQMFSNKLYTEGKEKLREHRRKRSDSDETEKPFDFDTMPNPYMESK